MWTKLKAFYSLFIQKDTQWGTKGEQFEQEFAAQFQKELPQLIQEATQDIIHDYESGKVPREEVQPDETLDVDPSTTIEKIEHNRRTEDK